MPSPKVEDISLLRTIADDLPVAIWLGAVPSGDVVYVNKAFEVILGMGPPEGAAAGNYVAPYSVHTRDGIPYPERDMPYERVLRARDTVVIDDLVIHRGSKRIYLRVYAKPLLDAEGNITHVLEAFDDISREVLAEQARVEGETRLRHAQRLEAVGNLAGGIAHDFNNMLAAIKILTAHLERTESDAARVRLLGDIGQVVDSAAKLTHTLLRFSRRGDAQVQPIAIPDLIASVGELCRRTFDKRIEIAVDSTERAVVLGDPGQLEQVVMNLVVNARDAMSYGGRLTLRCHDDGASRVFIDVVDTGPGIEPALRDRVFEPYFTTKTSGAVKGTGLGLATVYGILQAHGGSVEILDTPGGGATVRVKLPRADAHVEVTAPRVVPRAAAQRGTLLIVEDEPPVRRAAVLALEGLGYRVLAAENGEEAVHLYREHHRELDAVLLDIVMPGMGGRQTYSALRAIDDQIPVIVTSGLALGDEARATMELGAHAFTPKPYDVHALCETIEQLRARRTNVTSV
jgi:two-component system cell cycle sensor histidine kinase/response regulator CckA